MAKKTVLIVEDDVTIGRLTADYLETIGFHTLWAKTCDQGILLACTIPIDCILLDFWLDNGQCATWFMSEVKARGVQKSGWEESVVLFTAASPTQWSNVLQPCGLSKILKKPFSLEELENTVKEASGLVDRTTKKV